MKNRVKYIILMIFTIVVFFLFGFFRIFETKPPIGSVIEDNYNKLDSLKSLIIRKNISSSQLDTFFFATQERTYYKIENIAYCIFTSNLLNYNNNSRSLLDDCDFISESDSVIIDDDTQSLILYYYEKKHHKDTLAQNQINLIDTILIGIKSNNLYKLLKNK